MVPQYIFSLSLTPVDSSKLLLLPQDPPLLPLPSWRELITPSTLAHGFSHHHVLFVLCMTMTRLQDPSPQCGIWPLGCRGADPGARVSGFVLHPLQFLAEGTRDNSLLAPVAKGAKPHPALQQDLSLELPTTFPHQSKQDFQGDALTLL